jgi:hypothetical protein
MPIQIMMPALSPTMEKGKLLKWLVSEGQMVSPATPLPKIETDKATVEVEAVDQGKVAKPWFRHRRRKGQHTPIAARRRLTRGDAQDHVRARLGLSRWRPGARLHASRDLRRRHS